VRGDSLSADPVWMYANAEAVLKKLRASVELTDEEQKILDSRIRHFEGNKLFHEGRIAFRAGDMPVAIDRLKKANVYLNSLRIRAILFGIRTMPRLLQRVYEWRLHQVMPFTWARRREVG
jgi:hypothetical protein